ncbi:transcription factor [Stagonosporopsis vannaccii]|nr:transcription factor [Stagonosporopsis vannaccii]
MYSRSRSKAACDTCRLRKTRCVKQSDQDRCVLCSFHGLACTFRRGHVRKERRTPSDRLVDDGPDHEQPADTQYTAGLAARSPDSAHPSQLDDDDDNNDHDEDVERIRGSACPRAFPKILDDTLGLDPVNNAEYVGSSDHRDPILLDLRQHRTSGSSFVRRMDDRTLFVVRPDIVATSGSKPVSYVDSIEAAVQPMGRRLVDLYFQFVHPSFPVLHKDVFIAKHQRSYRCFAPSLLAAVYLLALEWMIHDDMLASWNAARAPDVALIERVANASLQEELQRPTLSTLEAGILLMQRSRVDSSERPCSSVWRLHAQLVAMSYDLGLHIDCSFWSIPEWEAGLRRRLSWALYVQDRWTAFVHGRPTLISQDDWDLSPCSSSDFPEYSRIEGLGTGAVAAPTGWRLFLRHIELSQILDDVNRKYYVASAQRRHGSLDRMGPRAAVDLAQPILVRLSEWKAALPEDLAFSTPYGRSVCASASLHLAYHSVIIALYRALVRVLAPQAPRSLHTAVRGAARQKLEAAVQLLNSISPEHTAAFWGGVAPYQIAMIGAFAGLLWATAEDSDEMAWCATRWDDFKWALRIRGNGASFAREALRLLECETGSPLEVWSARQGRELTELT